MARAEIISELLKRASLTPPDLLAADIAAALADVGGTHLVLYVVDYEQMMLQPVALAATHLNVPHEGISIDGTMAGTAFQHQDVLSAETEDGWRVWAPVRERSERIGVLELGFKELDEEILTLAEDLGRLVGHLVHTAGRYTDLIELRRRRHGMSLAAEMQWDMLMPALTFEAPGIAIAGLLEPAYEVAGDGFDYSLNGDILYFTMLDSMGHGLQSALASALALAAFRNGRRRGLTLPTIATVIDEALLSQFDGDVFVTAHLARLEVATGLLAWVNAGHPDPLLIRGGSKVVAEPHCPPCLPLGLGSDEIEERELRLEPGDRLLFYSDGVTEARPADRRLDQFGVERLIGAVERHVGMGLPASEVLRRIVREVQLHRDGTLEDDATLVLVEWNAAPPTTRSTAVF